MNIKITDSAIAHIKKIIFGKDGKKIFHLGVKASGCSGYRYDPQILDQPKENDISINITDDFTIYVDAKSEKFLQDCVIDYVTLAYGQSQLIFKNPNVVNECGCGESFQIKENTDE